MNTSAAAASAPNPTAALRMLAYSSLGLVMFFLPVEIAGKTTILFDHAATWLATQQRPLAIAFVLALMAWGAASPFIKGSWRASTTATVFSALKVLGLVLALMYLSGAGPAVLFQKDMLPFLFDKLALTVGLIVPLGAVALAFLVGFGLLELVGVLMQPIMRPIWRTPGHSAIDAVASFVGSYSVALLITNRVYLEGKYTAREAAIIATGFSTVSAAFMIIVAKTLSLMPAWNFYFWSTFVIAFAVTAITAWIPPISRMDNTGGVSDALPAGRSRWQAAWDAGLAQANGAPPLWRVLRDNLRDGLAMASAVVPTILAVGLIGLLKQEGYIWADGLAPLDDQSRLPCFLEADALRLDSNHKLVFPLSWDSVTVIDLISAVKIRTDVNIFLDQPSSKYPESIVVGDATYVRVG